MSKDPAVLFYYQDFLVGTEFMEDAEVGKYIRLLCHQYDKGTLTKEHILKICKTSDIDMINKCILEKFTKDEQGNYYNRRAKEEKEKRVKFSESRRKNRSSVKDMNKICGTSDSHIENENENINKDVNYILLFNDLKNEFELTEKQEELFLLWLKYKSEKGQTYKKTGLKTLIKTKLSESNGSEDELEKMVNNSISNNYSGLFSLNSNKFNKPKNKLGDFTVESMKKGKYNKHYE